MAGAKLAAPDGFLPLIHDFLSWQPIAPRNVPELARISARLCRFLRDEVIEQLGIKNAKLSELKDDWKALLFPDADDAKFADGYAQAVTFGLLMAKSKGLSLADGLDEIAKELGKTNTLIGAALRLLTEQDLKLGPALDTLTRVLDVVDWGVIAKGDPEAWLYFYENFLEVYDNKLRKLTGSYYTPPEVVQAMVRLCDEALRSYAAATQSNIAPAALAALAKAFGAKVDPVDVFGYVAALLACPAYTARFKADLIRPGLRVPPTAVCPAPAEPSGFTSWRMQVRSGAILCWSSPRFSVSPSPRMIGCTPDPAK